MEVLVDVLRSHGRSSAVVAQLCCVAIGHITAGNVENQVKYGSVAGSIEIIVDVLKTYSRIPDVSNACCHAIEKLCTSYASNQAKFTSLNIRRILQVDVKVKSENWRRAMSAFR
jgi:hypothetical protein